MTAPGDISKETQALVGYIARACDPYNFEPDLALNLEIADIINNKKGNYPRAAALLVARYINDRNPTIAMLALNLLDMLVKNCGYPFHLQISTKEFLNDLVRRFPEFPPARPNKILLQILELIEQWHQTLCTNSRYKGDLKLINDMHRLLSFKGYTFPRLSDEEVSILTPSQTLKSAEELEKEDQAANAAKLHELIRRGRTQDLQEANRLMKLMSGYDNSKKIDYRMKAAQELDRVRRKAKLLGEMLAGVQDGDIIGNGDIYEEMASQIRSCSPTIQKICEEEQEDEEAVSKVIQLNDFINLIDQQYYALKNKNYKLAKEIQRKIPEQYQSQGRTIKESAPLIDLEFGTNEADKLTDKSALTKHDVSHGDDLLGLSFGDEEDTNSGKLGMINLNSSGLAAILGSQQHEAQPFTKTANQNPLKSSINFSSSSKSNMNASQTNANSLTSEILAPLSRLKELKSQEKKVLLHNSFVRSHMTVLKREPQYVILQSELRSQLPSGIIEQVTFEAAVPRSLTLEMKPQSGTELLPNSSNTIEQLIIVAGTIPSPSDLRFSPRICNFKCVEGMESTLLWDLLNLQKHPLTGFISNGKEGFGKVVQQLRPEVLTKNTPTLAERKSRKIEDILIFVQKLLKYSVNSWSFGFCQKLYNSTDVIGVLSD